MVIYIVFVFCSHIYCVFSHGGVLIDFAAIEWVMIGGWEKEVFRPSDQD